MGATRIGVDNLVYAVMSTGETSIVKPTYSTPVVATGVMSLGVNPNTSIETLFADDGPMETASSLGSIDVEIQKNALSTSEKADLLGHTIDSKGGLVYGSNDVPPYVALGFRSLKSNGKYKYTWLYKGKFQEPEESNETKGDTVSFQADTISGSFAKLLSKIKVKQTAGDLVGKEVTLWKYEMDEDNIGADAVVIKNWFTAVQFPPTIV